MARADAAGARGDDATVNQVRVAETRASDAAMRQRELAVRVVDSLRRSAVVLERSATLAEQLDERHPRARAEHPDRIQRARDAAHRSLALARRVA